MKFRVLVADDDEELLESVALELEHLGLEHVVRAQSGAELMDHVANGGPFGLIVTDINMPWMNGLDVMRSMRKAGLITPILLITGDAGVLAAGLGEQVLLLRKPFDTAALQSAVNQLVPGLLPVHLG